MGGLKTLLDGLDLHLIVTFQVQMTRDSFDTLAELIQGHPIFANKSYQKQAPVEFQLMVALQRLGHSGNAASLLCYASEYTLAGESFNLLKVSEFPCSSYLTCIDALNIPRGDSLLVYPLSPGCSADLGGGVHQMAGP